MANQQYDRAMRSGSGNTLSRNASRIAFAITPWLAIGDLAASHTMNGSLALRSH